MITATLRIFGFRVAELVLEGTDDIEAAFAALDELESEEERE